MVSDRFYFFLNYIFMFCSSIGSIPYTWNHNCRCLHKSARCHRLIRIHASILLTSNLTQVGRCIYYFSHGDLDNFHVSYCVTCVRFLMLQIYGWMVFMEDDTYTFSNFLFSYLHQINRKYMPSYDPNTSKVQMVIEFIAACIFFQQLGVFLLTTTVVIIFPHSGIGVGDFVPTTAPFLIKLPLCYLFPIYTSFMLILNGFLIILTCYAYSVYFVPFVILELRLGRCHYKSIPELRKPPMLLIAYRAVQVFQIQVNNLMGIFLMPTQLAATQIVIMGAYTIIRHGSRMKSATVVMMAASTGTVAVFWCFMLLIGGYLHFFGSKVLDSWKYHNWRCKYERKIMAKFRKSCKPVMLSYKNVYIIKRLTVLKFIRSISRGILRALLAL